MVKFDILLSERLVEQPRNDGQVPALIVRRQKHRILVLASFRHLFVCVSQLSSSRC